jgi:hypothetical protein
MFKTFADKLRFVTVAWAAGVVALVITLSSASPVQSQGPPGGCYPRDDLMAWLQETFDEAPIGVGVANGRLVELLTSKDGVTWTLIITSPEGVSCLVVGGEAWRQLRPPLKGPAV